jgi:tetratricopeptide (TPR) repeat protein
MVKKAAAAVGGKGKAPVKKASGADEVERLLGAARDCLDQLDPQGAVEACRAAVALDGDSVAALDQLAEACLACGESEEAKAALSRSVELSPDGGAGRYMYLGQLSSGGDALNWFGKGIAGLREALAAVDGASGGRAALHAAWSEAVVALAIGLCSVAEIYLTDACDEPDAEAQCDALTAEAVALVGRLPRADVVEPFQSRASLKLSQQDEEAAEALLLTALDIVRRAEGAGDTEGGDDGAGGDTGGEVPSSGVRRRGEAVGASGTSGAGDIPLPEMPSLELRLSLSKMLMEVGRAADALEVLLGARAEDEDSCEIRYLLCTAALMAGEVRLYWIPGGAPGGDGAPAAHRPSSIPPQEAPLHTSHPLPDARPPPPPPLPPPSACTSA